MKVARWLLGIVVGAGCISESAQPNRDAGADSAPPSDSGDGTIAPDTDPPEIGEEVAPDAGDDGVVSDGSTGDGVVVAECINDEDCGDHPPAETCHAWVCIDRVCNHVAVGADCDDGDPCTEGDFCDGGTCAFGFFLDCTTLSPDCWQGTGDACVPFQGCPGVPMTVGSGCYDGFGDDGGSCVDGWLIPFDQCDGAGRCVDTSFLVPGGVHPLAGTWHAVISSAPPQADHHTGRATLEFGVFGDIAVSDVASTSTSWPDDVESRPASYCADLSGPVAVNLGFELFEAIADPTRNVMMLSEPLGSMIGVAVRPLGEGADVDGTYNLVATSQRGASGRALVTWHGTIGFREGCITETGSFETSSGLGLPLRFGADGNDCFEQDGDLWRLDVDIISLDLSSLGQRWRGAIGPDGDVILLTREDGDMWYGTIMLVRDRDIAGRGEVAGTWRFASQRGGIDQVIDTSSATIFERGVLYLGEALGPFSGTVETSDGEAFVQGAWWHTGAHGRYSQRAAFGDTLLHHTGFLAPNPSLLFAWVVAGPEGNPDEEQTLRLSPREGSLFVGVRVLPFEEPFTPGGSSL